MKECLFIRIVFCWCFLVSIQQVLASASSASASVLIPVKRTVLALWDSSEAETKDASTSEIHRNLELVLNHYGLKAEYVDISKGVPSYLLKEKNLGKYRGVVTWFLDNQMKDPLTYLKLLNKIHRRRLPLMILGNLGFLKKNKKTNEEFDVKFINKYLNPFGLQYQGDYFDNPMILQPEILKGSSRVEFERKISNEISSVRVVKRRGSKGETWLRIKIEGTQQSSDVVFANPYLTYVQSGYEVFTNPITYENQWRVNPFELVKYTFFKEGTELVPDITTLYGSRTFYSHIDGDGFINISLIDRKSYSGEIIAEKIIKYYKLPIMVSVIIAEVSAKYLGNKSIEKFFQSIFSLSNVEGGSHTFTHPMSWNMEPSLDEKKIYLKGKAILKHKGPIVGYPIKNYVMNYRKEVIGSLDYINKNLMPKGKKAKTLLWSGSCMPPLKPLRLLDEYHYLNMNGGDGKFNGPNASYTGLSPLYRNVDGYIQVYSSNANENLYTHLWEGPYSGFREVIDAFKNTEKPIRIRPINIYYHFYSGERVSSLKALKETYDFALSQKINPIFPTRYIEMVHGWINTEIREITHDHYHLSNYGKMRTLRIDKVGVYPDYRKSVNIVGHSFLNGSTYIFIGSDANADLYLTKEKPTNAYVSEASVLVNSFKGNIIEGESFYPGYININRNGVVTKIEVQQVGHFKKVVPAL